MRHDIFEFNGEMTVADRIWRVLFLVLLIVVLLLDLFVWRP